MADTIRTKSALQTLLADNVAGDISPQDIRDFLVSVIGSEYRVTVNTATYTLTGNDRTLHVTRTATGTLTTDHRVIDIKDAGNNAGTNNITVETEAAEKIEFTTDDLPMSSNGMAITLYSDGTDWFIK